MEQSVGRTVKLFRIEKGFSQGDIEKRTGLLRSYLSRVENGHTTPSLNTLRRLADALEVDLAVLVGKPGGEVAKGASFLGDKRLSRFWNLMRRYAPKLSERDRRLLAGLARKMATAH